MCVICYWDTFGLTKMDIENWSPFLGCQPLPLCMRPILSVVIVKRCLAMQCICITRPEVLQGIDIFWYQWHRITVFVSALTTVVTNSNDTSLF
jgi:hypothetical protein